MPLSKSVIGFFLPGLGLGLHWASDSIGRNKGRHWRWKAIAVCLSVGLMQGSQFINIPQAAPLTFYGILAFTYVILVFAVVVVSLFGNKSIRDSAPKNSWWVK